MLLASNLDKKTRPLSLVLLIPRKDARKTPARTIVQTGVSTSRQLQRQS